MSSGRATNFINENEMLTEQSTNSLLTEIRELLKELVQLNKIN